MRIPIDRSSSEPLYAQIARFLRERCRSGALEPETRLPSARSLAEALGVSRITTEAAYSELEAEGILRRRIGSGTFVARGVLSPRAAGEEPIPAWQRLALAGAPASILEPGAVPRGDPGGTAIDLASGLPDPALLPLGALRGALRKACAEEGGFGYGDPRGYGPFREAAARILSSRGIDARADEILVTSGSQEGLLLFALLARRRPGPVLVESPTYSVALGLFRALGLETVGVGADSGGMRVDELERALRGPRPSFIYCMPNFQNPTGASLALERRRALVELAGRAEVPILEDDYVGDLRLEGRELPALVSLAAPGAAIYSGTFSKMLAPALRIGFLLARGPAYRLLLDLKRAATLASPGLEQRALARVATVGGYDSHVRRLRRACRARRDALMAGLSGLPAGFSVERPAGGLFAWLVLPEGLGAERLAAACRDRGVLAFPGRPCFPDPADPAANRCLRLCFAAEDEGRVAEGARRLVLAALDSGAPGGYHPRHEP